MNVIVHYPKSTNAQQILSQKAAEVHAQSIINQIGKMHLSEEQTKRLVNMICDKIKQN